MSTYATPASSPQSRREIADDVSALLAADVVVVPLAGDEVAEIVAWATGATVVRA